MSAPTPPPPSRRAALVLALLLLVYSFNFLDRQILGILAGLVKRDLHLTDARLGLLGGVPFALLYSTLAVPLAVVADRRGRARVIGAALVVWSGFTALCAAATGFWSLFLCRLGVGAGEAGGVAPSYALIAATFPPGRRARALGVYALGVPLGSAAGVLGGAWVAAHVGWRAAFVVVGLAGLAIAPVVALLVRDPPAPPETRPAPAAATFAALARRRSFWLLAFAASMSSMAGYGLAFWMPQVVERSFGLDLATTSYFVGSLLLLGGTLGVWLGGVVADRAGRRDRGAFPRVAAFAWLASAPLFAAGFLAPSATAAWALLFLPNALNLVWLGPLVAAVQHLVPPARRAAASAAFLLVNNLVGLGAGSWLIGRLSDALAPLLGHEALRWSAVAASGLYLVAAGLAFAAAAPLRRDWIDA